MQIYNDLFWNYSSIARYNLTSLTSINKKNYQNDSLHLNTSKKMNSCFNFPFSFTILFSSRTNENNNTTRAENLFEWLWFTEENNNK